MLGLSVKLLQWSLFRNRLQLLIMVLAVIGSLSSYVLLGTAIREMSETVIEVQRSDWPFDLAITGNIDEKELKQIKEVKGVLYTESIVMVPAYFYSYEMEFLLLPHRETKLIIELGSGNLPLSESEIVIPSAHAMAYHLSLGDVIRVLPRYANAEVQEFKISGITSSKRGVITKPLLSEEGLRRLMSAQTLPSLTAVQLDGKIDLDYVSAELKKIDPGFAVKKYEDNYAKTKQDLNMSDSLVVSLRFLILGITATSLAVLLYIGQRSGSYQTGVLLAMGVKKAWLIFPAIIQTTLIFLIGFLLTGVFLPFVSKYLGLATSQGLLFLSLAKDVGVYYGVGVLSTILINLQFLATPIPKLMKDTW